MSLRSFAMLTIAVPAALATVTGSADAQAAGPDLVTNDVADLVAQQIYSHESIFKRPSRDDVGIPVEGWLLYPAITIGSVYDDNLYSAHFNKKSALGIEVRPTFSGVYKGELNTLTVYGGADLMLYPSLSKADTTDGRVGLIDVYTPSRDLSLKAYADFARISTASLSASSVVTNSLLATYNSAVNQFTAGASGRKSFDRVFVSAGVDGSTFNYDATTDTLGQPISLRDQNGSAVVGHLRGGLLLSPDVYAYAEGTGNARSFDTGLYDSQGYRAVAGLGAARLSLFSGEIFAGYQGQDFHTKAFGSPAGGVFGGKVGYYPLRDLSFALSVDQTYGQSSIGAIGASFGSSTKVSTVAFSGQYAMTRTLTLSGSLGYAHTEYLIGPRRDDGLVVSAQAAYAMTRNLGLNLTYRYIDLRSNFTNASYTRNVITLGASYSY